MRKNDEVFSFFPFFLLFCDGVPWCRRAAQELLVIILRKSSGISTGNFMNIPQKHLVYGNHHEHSSSEGSSHSRE